MKILVVHNSYRQHGGEDVVFAQESQLLERHGHTVSRYCRSNWEVDRYSGLKRLKLGRDLIWSKDTRREFSAVLLNTKPDVVHVHNTFVMISPAIYSACTEAGVPVVQTLHNYRLYCPAATFFRDGHICEECVQHSLLRSVAHGCYRNSRTATAAVGLMLAVHRQRETWSQDINIYIALTEYARNKFIDAGLPGNKVAVKPNFVHPDPPVHPDRVGNYALFVGRLSPEKRVSTLLAGWARLHGRIPLLVIGGGPERVELEGEALGLGLSDVTFRGQLSREQTIAAMHGARFLVFSSEWYENFPVTIAESFACGIPVIASHLGAMQEIVEDGRTGLHFTPGDADDLADKVDWAWTHPERMQWMGKEARHEYESKYTAEKNYPLLMDIYNRALGRSEAGPLLLDEFQKIPDIA